jgi:hypothetical protein
MQLDKYPAESCLKFHANQSDVQNFQFVDVNVIFSNEVTGICLYLRNGNVN